VRILHGPVNTAGQPYALVQALRRRGVEAELVVFKERPPFRWDLPLLKALGKKVVIQFWGSDVRGKSPETLTYLRYADAIIVGSYHMLDFVPEGAHAVLPGLDLVQWPPSSERPAEGKPVRIVHAPSNRRLKGTVHVAAGWYGIFGLETMALGKAVVGYISPQNADRLEAARGVRPPLVSVSPETLAEELETLIYMPERRLELGRLGRSYVEQVHDIEHSAEQVMRIYQQV
jgi:glycosyltransferase involved in cell wall biosynthesis